MDAAAEGSWCSQAVIAKARVEGGACVERFGDLAHSRQADVEPVIMHAHLSLHRTKVRLERFGLGLALQCLSGDVEAQGKRS